jgi:hypothetical protein
MLDRRQFIAAGTVALGTSASPGIAAPQRPDLFADIQERTFRFFWDTTNPKNGLAVDRWPTPSFASVAAVGFALTAYPIGVERGWITRAQARDRTLATLRFFRNAPQGDAPSGTAGHKGFFYHFLDMERGLRFRQTELSSIDTALLFGGMMFAEMWFDGKDPAETEIRDLARRIYARADWRWFQQQDIAKRVSMGWHPESGFLERPWFGYTEGQILYILALGAPDFALGSDAYEGWCSTYFNSWRGNGPTRHLAFGPQLAHQYTQCWVDMRGIRDATMRKAGFDYFENSRRATLIQRDYAKANPGKWKGYSADIWGLDACDGPGDMQIGDRQFFGYAARGPVGLPDGLDDGTIAPVAAIGSLPFAPEIVEPCARALHDRYGAAIYSKYGFLDSFNPTFTDRSARIEKGKITETAGWVDDDYIGIDQGAIVVMIENHKSGMIWDRMREHPAIKVGLKRAGFTGGWLAT